MRKYERGKVRDIARVDSIQQEIEYLDRMQLNWELDRAREIDEDCYRFACEYDYYGYQDSDYYEDVDYYFEVGIDTP